MRIRLIFLILVFSTIGAKTSPMDPIEQGLIEATPLFGELAVPGISSGASSARTDLIFLPIPGHRGF